MALNGIAGAGTGSVDFATHAIEHGLRAVYPEITHGAGLGVFFSAWILYRQDANP
jgi:alcohol dehydrogenase